MQFLSFGIFLRAFGAWCVVSLFFVVSQAVSAAPPAASVSTRVGVPTGMQAAPFDVERKLLVPPGFGISVYARLSSARFMAVAPNGDLLVSRPGPGRVMLVRPLANGTATVSTFISGLKLPHDIVFHTIGSQTYVYVSEANQINRFRYMLGDTVASGREIVVTGLPDSSNPELQGTYGHQLKNIALDPAHNLYVSIASASNASVTDAISTPVRCAIYRYPFQPGNAAVPHGPGELMARGLRNAEGLAFVPGTDQLWAVVNNRDEIPYPFRSDITGDGITDFGKVIRSYVDDNPPEEFVNVKQDADYGWPYANPNPATASGMDNMPFAPDYNNNRSWSVYPASRFTRVDKGIQAHSAPLGLSFLQDSSFPVEYRNGAVVALHGSWNRQQKTGYKVIYFPWDPTTNRPGAQIDLVTGWLDDVAQEAWGRPVDAVADGKGNLFISDNVAGAIYRLALLDGPTPGPDTDPALQVVSFSLVDPGTNIEIPGYEALTASSLSLSAAAFPKGYCLRANTSGPVESILFSYNSNIRYRVENVAPYYNAVNVGGPGSGARCSAWTAGIRIGTHRVAATPYDLDGGLGDRGPGKAITITVQ